MSVTPNPFASHGPQATCGPEVEDLVSRAQAGDRAALSALLARFRPMARLIGKKRQSASLSAEDAEGMAMEVFVTTLAAFNPMLAKIGAYWNWKANHAITDHFRRSLRCGRHNYPLMKAYFGEVAEAREAKGQDFIDSEDFAKRHGVRRRRVWHVASVGGASVSLDQPVCSNGEIALGDSVPAETQSPAAALEDQSSIEFISARLATLDPRSREVVERYFGFGNYEPETLKDIGERFGFTMAWASELLRRAIASMRDEAMRMDRMRLNVRRLAVSSADIAIAASELKAARQEEDHTLPCAAELTAHRIAA